jgi:hypothetical protein
MELNEKNFRYRILGADSDKMLTGQGGLKEKLLCDSCENIFSNLENYVKNMLYGGIELTFHKIGPRTWSVGGLDYIKFKLFQLSVLWRASVSTQEFFKSVNLGQKHESQIRKMLLDQEP